MRSNHTPKHQSAMPTTDEVLDFAAEEFARKGLAGARIDTIAAASGVNKATLYYRIGDKQALYDAVLERELGAMARRTKSATEACTTPTQKLRAFIAALASSLDRAAPILLREVASGGESMPDHAIAHMGSLVAQIRSILSEGEVSGDFRHVNPFIIHMMIVGGLNLYVANEPLRLRAARDNPEQVNPEHFISVEAAAAEIHDYILAALRPIEPTTINKATTA